MANLLGINMAASLLTFVIRQRWRVARVAGRNTGVVDKPHLGGFPSLASKPSPQRILGGIESGVRAPFLSDLLSLG
jgi:hypothetical protein